MIIYSGVEHENRDGDPFTVKIRKEWDDNNLIKNERKDPKAINMLVKDVSLEPHIPESVYEELTVVMNIRWQLVKCKKTN